MKWKLVLLGIIVLQIKAVAFAYGVEEREKYISRVDSNRTRVIKRESAGQIEAELKGYRDPDVSLMAKALAAAKKSAASGANIANKASLSSRQNTVSSVLTDHFNLLEDVPDFLIQFSTYWNENGHLDYLVYQLYRNDDKLNERVSEELEKALPAKLSVLVGSPDSLKRVGMSSTLRLGRRRMITKDDEKPYAVFTVKAAREVRDTLSIRFVDFSNQVLTAVPSEIYRFPNLKSIYLNGNQIKDAKLDLSRLPQLQSLDLSYNVLTSEGFAITGSGKLSHVNLMRNQLTVFPISLYNAPGLTGLSLTQNRLVSFRYDPARLPKITGIDLTENSLTSDSVVIESNKLIGYINLQKNRITDLPGSLKKSRRLTSLWLGNNALSGLSSKSFNGLKRVTVLNLYGCDLTSLPSSIRRLKRLNELDLYHNQLTELPRAVTRLKRLKTLAASNNKLAGLPDKVYRLKRLEKLYAHHNQIKDVPGKLYKMKQLQLLDLNNNWFSVVPESILNLPSLKILDLTANNLSEVPTRLESLGALEELYIGENPVTHSTRIASNGMMEFVKQLQARIPVVSYSGDKEIK